MALPGSHVTHPHVTQVPGYCGGRPIICGTRFPVSSVVFYVLRLGMTPEELVREFPHLTLAQVYDAVSYYYDHKQAIDQELHASTLSPSHDLREGT